MKGTFMRVRPALFFLVVALGGLGGSGAVRAAQPRDFLPPPLPWSGASRSLVVPPDHPWITPAEKSGLLDSPSYDDTIDYLKRLCAASPRLELREFGRTAQDRPLYVVVATRERERAPTPEALREGGKPTFLVQAGIHSGEIDGKDAGLMLLRDLAFGGKDALLDRANLLFIPVLNADGHERSSAWNRPNQRGPARMGWRTTAQNLNLNRDYIKADAPEMRALLGLLNTWMPALYFDILSHGPAPGRPSAPSISLGSTSSVTTRRRPAPTWFDGSVARSFTPGCRSSAISPESEFNVPLPTGCLSPNPRSSTDCVCMASASRP